MKNKKILLFIFAILAFLGLGIGYAALTDTLTLTGTVTGSGVNDIDNDVSNAEAFQLKWVNYNVVSATHNGTIDGLADIDVDVEISSDGSVMTISINNMALAGDSVGIDLTFKNDSDYHVSNCIFNQKEIAYESDPSTVVSGSGYMSRFNLIWQQDDTAYSLHSQGEVTKHLIITLNENVNEESERAYTFEISVNGSADPKCNSCPA